MTFEEMQTIVTQILESQRRVTEQQQQFQRDIQQLLAGQRELQESDLRRQAELSEISGQIQGLVRIVEHLVTNAEVHDRMQEDHEQPIRRLEQE
jgi:type II secretory pathway predicted ATPase ExeA